ncbi:uncharacterized protein G2W53_033024 [Senna tora]|uniref:Uncharacterized protein n=1 Tax=Senna tora TaxID=362788 RepID=A0A834SWX3_9FABA|nr:uncharacterized protein G2W53_033024 [Senna tora]
MDRSTKKLKFDDIPSTMDGVALENLDGERADQEPSHTEMEDDLIPELGNPSPLIISTTQAPEAEQTQMEEDNQPEPALNQVIAGLTQNEVKQNQENNKSEHRSHGVKIKPKKMEVANSATMRQNSATQNVNHAKKTYKNHLERSQEHTLVTSHSQSIKIGQNITRSPIKPKESVLRVPLKGSPDPPKAKQKKTLMRSYTRIRW